MNDYAEARPPLISPRARILGIWPQNGWQSWILVWPVLACSVLYSLLQYTYAFQAPDFFALWSYGRLMHQHPAADIYDPVRLHSLQVGLGMNPTWDMPFPYPPVFLLVVWPLGLLPLNIAYWAWIGPVLAAFVWSVAGSRPRPLLALGIAALPLSTACVAAGQGGFLTGALFVGGLRLIARRPWIGGLLLGVLTFKPHLGMLVPVALCAAGAWRGIGVAVATIAALGALTVAAFGAGAWTDWLAALPDYQRQFDLKLELLHLRPTIVANFALAGLPAATAYVAQAVTIVVMATLVWVCCRRGLSDTAIAVVIAATAVANPHAFFYDLPMLVAAVVILGQGRIRNSSHLHWAETVLLLLVLCIPVVMASTQLPVSMPILLAFAAWACLQGLREVEAWPARHAVANCSSASRAYSPP